MLTDRYRWLHQLCEQVFPTRWENGDPEGWTGLPKVTQPGENLGLTLYPVLLSLFPMACLGAKRHEHRTLLLPSPPPGVCVPTLPCGGKEADGKQEELEIGLEGFSLDDIQLGLGLVLGSDTDKLGDGQCQRLHPSTPHRALLPARPRAGSLSTQS